MNNENEDLENVSIIEQIKIIMSNNQYFEGKESNKRTVLRINDLLCEFNIDFVISKDGEVEE